MCSFNLGSLLQGQTRIAILNGLVTQFSFVLDFAMLNQPLGNHRLGSSNVFIFDLGPLPQDQTRISKEKSAYNSHILDPRGL